MLAYVYCAYGDESRDETGSRVYAVAAVFGSEADWTAIEEPWKDRLGGKVFHASDCEFGRGDFENLKPGEGRKLYGDLVKILADSNLLAHGEAINVADFKESFPGDFEHAPYLWAFGDVVQSMSELASVSMPPGIVRITFDRNEDVEYNATSIYEFMRRAKKIGARDFLADEIAFACRRSLGIQVADLAAREAMKRLDADLCGRAIRLSFRALHDAHRFSFLAIGKSNFERKKAQFGASYLERASLVAYRQWLNEHRLQDCTSNRIAHLEMFPEVWVEGSALNVG